MPIGLWVMWSLGVTPSYVGLWGHMGFWIRTPPLGHREPQSPLRKESINTFQHLPTSPILTQTPPHVPPDPLHPHANPRPHSHKSHLYLTRCLLLHSTLLPLPVAHIPSAPTSLSPTSVLCRCCSSSTFLSCCSHHCPSTIWLFGCWREKGLRRGPRWATGVLE